MISALSKRSLLLFLSLALTLFSALLIPPASALTPAEVSLDALANQKFNGSDLKLIKKVSSTNSSTNTIYAYKR
jgi:hypothetical protein